MDKAQQFITMVQTAYVVDEVSAILQNRASTPAAPSDRPSALGFMARALEASETIPEDMSAYQAAQEFIHWMLSWGGGGSGPPPAWFA
jgi:hypothetical protein